MNDPTEPPARPPVPGAPLAFHVMAKPRGAIRNLDCEYCFFLPDEMLYPAAGSGCPRPAEIYIR